MKILTFLGTSDYKEVTYILADKEVRTKYFPRALAGFYPGAEMLVFLTNEAAHKHWAEFQNELRGVAICHPVSIPSGKTEDELWAIFDILLNQISPGDEVIFDITHTFRSLPFLVFIAASFFRSAQDVRFHSILYGAYEARDAMDRTPVFDLTPFLILLDWTNASDRFLKTGDARPLADLLRTASRGLPLGDEVRTELRNCAGDLSALSQALFLVRPHETARRATRLGQGLDRVEKAARSKARPFVLLLRRIEKELLPFARETLEAQRAMIRWYLENQQYVHAYLMAREWLISLVCRWRACDIQDPATRDMIARELNRAARPLRKQQFNQGRMRIVLDRVPRAEELVSLWENVTNFRNDVAHCATLDKNYETREITTAMEEIAAGLDRLPIPK